MEGYWFHLSSSENNASISAHPPISSPVQSGQRTFSFKIAWSRDKWLRKFQRSTIRLFVSREFLIDSRKLPVPVGNQNSWHHSERVATLEEPSAGSSEPQLERKGGNWRVEGILLPSPRPPNQLSMNNWVINPNGRLQQRQTADGSSRNRNLRRQLLIPRKENNGPIIFSLENQTILPSCQHPMEIILIKSVPQSLFPNSLLPTNKLQMSPRRANKWRRTTKNQNEGTWNCQD